MYSDVYDCIGATINNRNKDFALKISKPSNYASPESQSTAFSVTIKVILIGDSKQPYSQK